MNLLFIAKPLSKQGNGVVSALKNEIKYLQELENVALLNVGVELEKDIAKTVYKFSEYNNIKDLPKPFNKPDIVVFEEVYKMEYMKLYKECLKLKIPYVVIPHGCLVINEQKKKKLKHDVANILLFNRYIKKASAIEFLNEEEKSNSHFKYRDSIIIPNSIECKKREFNVDEKKFRFVYIGRYSVITKGLDLLINTFINLKEWCIKNKVVLDLYGPKEDSELLDELKKKISDNKCDKFLSINGPVYDKEKDKVLEEASVFIQTSRNEGQPMGIIEALSLGIPCVVTYGTNFGKYCNENECGIGVNFDEDELKDAIIRIYDDSNYRKKCAVNATKVVKRDFEIKNIAKKTVSIYQEIIDNSNN